MKNRTKLGFTLIELLVVIAIIAILAAILFPVFAKAREKARQTTCLSNMKQIGMGIMQYFQDYDETYPPAKIHNDAGGNLRCLPDELSSYTKSWGIWKCLSVDGTGLELGTNPDSSTSHYQKHYACNTNLMPAIGTLYSGTVVSAARVEYPASTIAVYDCSYYGYGNEDSMSWWYNALGMRQGFEPHTLGMNIAWADGHAKWLKTTQIQWQMFRILNN